MEGSPRLTSAIVIAILLLPTSIAGQQVTGRVTDQSTGEPMAATSAVKLSSSPV